MSDTTGGYYQFTYGKDNQRVILHRSATGIEFEGKMGPFPVVIKELTRNRDPLRFSLSTIKSIDHPSIVPVLMWRLSGQILHIITPVYDMVTVKSLILKDLIDMAEAIKFLHYSGRCHTHLSPRYLRRNPSTGRIMITGIMESNIYHYLDVDIFCRDDEIYWAPEVLYDRRLGIYNGSTDVYSFCVIWVETMTGYPAKYCASVTTGDRSESAFVKTLDPTLSNFIEKCWQLDPNKRPMIRDVLNILNFVVKIQAATKIQKWWCKIYYNPYHKVGWAKGLKDFDKACAGHP